MCVSCGPAPKTNKIVHALVICICTFLSAAARAGAAASPHALPDQLATRLPTSKRILSLTANCLMIAKCSARIGSASAAGFGPCILLRAHCLPPPCICCDLAPGASIIGDGERLKPSLSLVGCLDSIKPCGLFHATRNRFQKQHCLRSS